MKSIDVNMACKCYEAPNSECTADIHWKQFPEDKWSPPELDGLYEVVDGLQQTHGFSDKAAKDITDAILKCWRPLDKTRQFMRDWREAQWPSDVEKKWKRGEFIPIAECPEYLKDGQEVVLCRWNPESCRMEWDKAEYRDMSGCGHESFWCHSSDGDRFYDPTHVMEIMPPTNNAAVSVDKDEVK